VGNVGGVSPGPVVEVAHVDIVELGGRGSDDAPDRRAGSETEGTSISLAVVVTIIRANSVSNVEDFVLNSAEVVSILDTNTNGGVENIARLVVSIVVS